LDIIFEVTLPSAGIPTARGTPKTRQKKLSVPPGGVANIIWF